MNRCVPLIYLLILIPLSGQELPVPGWEWETEQFLPELQSRGLYMGADGEVTFLEEVDIIRAQPPRWEEGQLYRELTLQAGERQECFIRSYTQVAPVFYRKGNVLLGIQSENREGKLINSLLLKAGDINHSYPLCVYEKETFHYFVPREITLENLNNDHKKEICLTGNYLEKQEGELFSRGQEVIYMTIIRGRLFEVFRYYTSRENAQGQEESRLHSVDEDGDGVAEKLEIYTVFPETHRFPGGYVHITTYTLDQFQYLPSREETFRALVLTQGLRIRKTPDRGGEILGKISPGTELRITGLSETPENIDGINAFWFSIAREDEPGWIFGGYVDLHPTLQEKLKG